MPILSSQPNHATIPEDALRLLSREEMANLERKIIPFLNALRAAQGRRPVIVPGENRIHGNIYGNNDSLKGAIVERITVNVTSDEIVFVFNKDRAEAILRMQAVCYSEGIGPNPDLTKPLLKLIVTQWPDLKAKYDYLFEDVSR